MNFHLCSLFTATRSTLEYLLYSAQHYRSSRKWYAVFVAWDRLYFDVSFCSVGVSISAPIWGRIVDSQGPRIVFVLSFVFLLGGYSGIKHQFDSGLPSGTSTLPALSFYILVLCNFLTGCGSFGGMTSSLNSTVKSFSDEAVSE